ncbi:MAG TPA: outer membrane lipoprotein carrier protein LolA [Tepidisphaeraceae bacterium]|jgi:outer membrane lipoprotein-sorting protein|nr:outer membrane lipoprotein carrier protein LolA [Tepidisphaeraceae bacterium]
MSIATARIAWPILFALTVFVAPSPAGDPTVATTAPAQSTAAPRPATLELMAQVQNNLRGIDSLEADFDQEKNLAVFKHKLNLSGRFALKQPNWVIWIVDKPVRYAIRVEGDEVRQWEEDTNKVQVTHVAGDPTFKAISEQLQAWFLGNYKALEASYAVFVLSDKPSPLSLRFVPKAGTMIAKLIAHIDLTFSPDNRTIEKMIIQEAGGDWTTLTIRNARINQPMKPQTWEIPPR